VNKNRKPVFPSQTTERLANMEHALSFLLASVKTQRDASGNAAEAIGRLELHLFAIIKLLIDANAFQFEHLQAAIQELLEVKDLHVFWGLKPPPGDASAPLEDSEPPPADGAASADGADGADNA